MNLTCSCVRTEFHISKLVLKMFESLFEFTIRFVQKHLAGHVQKPIIWTQLEIEFITQRRRTLGPTAQAQPLDAVHHSRIGQLQKQICHCRKHNTCRSRANPSQTAATLCGSRHTQESSQLSRYCVDLHCSAPHGGHTAGRYNRQELATWPHVQDTTSR